MTSPATVNPIGSQRLSKAEVLRGYRSFASVLSAGQYVQTRPVRLYYVIHKSIPPYLCSVGFAFRKSRNAVERNHARRLFREAYRRLKSDIQVFCSEQQLRIEGVFMMDLRRSAGSHDYHSIYASVEELLRLLKRRAEESCRE